MSGSTRDARVSKKKKVLIVGAGAAGMSCAHHLAEHPDRFDVTLVDSADYCGGQAFSIPIDKEKHGASWLNQGVQGGSYIFHHTMTMFARQGYHADPVKLQVSFGKGNSFWTNVYPTRLLANHQKEIARFKTMLSIVRWFELGFALLPIKILMKIFRFPEFFTNTVLLPMVALFLGTGNYTPEVPSIIMERLCTSRTYGMWYPPDKHGLVTNLPPMVVFPNFSKFYGDWKTSLEARGVKVRLSTELTHITKRDKTGVTVRLARQSKTQDTNDQNHESSTATRGTDSNIDSQDGLLEEFDELVLCILADSAKRVLDRTISFAERRILGSCKFANDITVTHSDTDYMKKHYENFYNPDDAVGELSGTDQSDRCNWAKESFKPMYLIKTYPQDRSKLEMCFDCSNYQGQFPPDIPFDRHVFQTIFLNKERDGHVWSLDEIDEAKIIRKDWWHQLCHSWTHYAFVVPWLWLIQGRRRTRFAASWTLVNAHEVACISGTAAAVSLGAEYPHDLERDRFAFLCFRLYYLFNYRRWYRKRAPPEGEGKNWATGFNGSVYNGAGVVDQERTMWREEGKSI